MEPTTTAIAASTDMYRRQPSTTSIDKESVKFNNVKVYANLNRSLIESINLETKQLPNERSNKQKATSQRRHTHYYCYIPKNVTNANIANRPTSTEELTDEHNETQTSNRRSSAHSLRRFMAKKVSDTYHSASRVKKFFSESFSMFK